MDRRIFLKLSSFSAAAIGLSLQGCADDELTTALFKPAFFSRFADQQTIHNAGIDYLKSFPSENSKSKLQDLLKEGVDDSARDNLHIQSAIDKKVQLDFDNGFTVISDGWVLSLTEARQCALFSLL
ncbi:MAG TPA: hypothetical protein PKM63_16625 [Panacibacter sp.]|nr:hypothetical protein [Panacibacter sp.]HNP45918.1 hypothetical protein [Panacibacter sp.]